jgi:guanylate kinase
MSDKKGKLVIISAPSGTGKGTVINQLIKLCPDFAFSISATTRTPRPGEANGVEYYFLTQNHFREMIANDEFLEYAEYVGNYYGTPEKPVDDFIKNGKTVLLDIEVLGAKQIMAKRPDAISIFIVPPDMNELENRLRGRGTDSEEKLAARLERARQELLEKDHYMYEVVNDSVSRAADEILSIIKQGKD